MPYIDEFTPHERSLLDKHYSTGLYTDEEWARVIQRVFEDRKREGAIDRAIQNSVSSRIGREIAGIQRAVEDPRIIGKTFQQYFDEMSEEPGIHPMGVAKGVGNILLSTVGAPAQVMDEIASGHVERPLQTAVGALHFLPYLRAGAGIGALGTAKSLPRVSQSLGKFATHPAVKWTSRGLETADIVVAGEEAGIEALGEGLLEIPGTFGPRMADWLRNRRSTQQVADQIQDQATGSKTSAPADDYQRLFDDAFQATADKVAADADFDADAATAALNQRRIQQGIDETVRGFGAGTQAPTAEEILARRQQFWQGQDLPGEQTPSDRQRFWEQNLTPEEQRQQFWQDNLSPQEQQQQRDSLANQFQLFEKPTPESREQFWRQNLTPQEQAELDAQQQQQAQSLQEYERNWGEFYRDQAGTYSEGRQMMEEEFQQGIRDPIEFRYNQIAEPLREQYGTATAELHRDADSRLRRLIGEKWYRRYRGRGDRELDERVQRMVKAAGQLVDDATDTDTDSTSTTQQAMNTIQRGVENQVGESATITRSGDERAQQITITPNRGQTTPDESQQQPETTPDETQQEPEVTPEEQTTPETTPDEQTEQTKNIADPAPLDKALSKIERMRQRREATQTQTETEDGVLTTEEGYRLVPVEFAPTLRDATLSTVPGYKIENADIDFANVVVHQQQDAEGNVQENSRWSASDQDVGASLGSQSWGETPEQSASKVVELVKQIGEEGYKQNVDTFRRDHGEHIDRSRPLTNEQQKYIEDVLHDRNRWEREGRGGVFKFQEGGSVTIETAKGQPDTAIIVGIPYLKSRLVKQIAGRNHEERWQSAIYSIRSADFVEAAPPQPTPEPTSETPTPEQTPEPTQEEQITPAADATPLDKAKSKIERMRQRRQGDDGELSDVTAEQRELRNEYLELTIADEIESLEAAADLDDFQTEVLTALKDPSTVEKQELRNEYLELTIADEIESLEAAADLDDFQTEVLTALRAVRDEPSGKVPDPGDDTFTAQVRNVLGNQGLQNSPPERKLQEAIRLQLESGESLSAPQLFYGAATFFGEGQYNSQQVYDVLEVAVNEYLEAQGLMNVNVDGATAVDNIEKIQAVEARLPRMSDRTAERDENQQYSTPFHYSYLVNWVANLQPDDVVVEPSAGTGNLAWAAKAMGAEVHVNDIGQFRHHLLQQNFQNVTNVDASNIAQQLPNVNATLVVMNPPFSSTRGQRKNLTLGMNMVESALETLQPGGRLVAIVNGGRDLTPEMRSGEAPGGGPHFNADNYRKIWNRIASKHAVRANLHVSGEVYKEFGTTFNTRLLVIDKYPVAINEPIRNQTDGSLKSEYDTMHKQRVDTIKEAVELLEGVRYERTGAGEQPSSESTREDGTQTTPGGRSVAPRRQSMGGEEGTVRSDTPGVVPGGLRSVRSGGGETTNDGGVGSSGTEDETSPRHGDGKGVGVDDDTGRGTQGPGTTTEGGVQSDRGHSGETDDNSDSVEGGRRSADTDVQTGIRRGDRAPVELDESENTKQVDAGKSWMPAADSHVIMGKEVSLVETVSLGLINSPDVTNVEIDIAEPAKSRYSDAQMKAIKLNIRAHDAHIEPEILDDAPPRRGMYNGDDTGVGKTWIAAGTIIHYQNQGINKHIVVGADKKWLKDFKEVFTLAGGNADTLFELGSQTDLPGSGVMLTTYGTLRGKGQETKRLSQILEWATGLKPPQSLLSPQTDFELAHFGELPRTFALAVTEYNAGAPMPTRVSEMINEWNGLSQGSGRSIDEIPDNYLKTYADILKEQETLTALEGDIGPAEWLKSAADFDGSITFDESHNMKESEGDKASNTGIRGRQLQRLLPDGRVTYYSATGTTVIEHIAYMERLGIWGRDKPFSDAEDFITQMVVGGLSAQEVMVRDLKAQGLFISRGLDMSDVMVDNLVHELTPVQQQTYNELANAWQEIRLYLHQYLGSLDILVDDADGGAKSVGDKKGDIWGKYYSKQLEFFQAVLNAFKMQTVIEDMKKQLDQGKKVSIQFTNTYEASQKRQIDRAEREGIDTSEIEFGAREFLEDYLDPETGVFPTYDYEIIYDPVQDKDVLREVTNKTNQIMEIEYTDARGRPKVERVPPGKPIPNVGNIQNRERILSLVYNSHMPEPPLDQFVQMFKDRGQEIAEITGRSERYYRNEEGERQKEKLSSGDAALRKLVEEFNANNLFGLAFSKKGATGANYPATDPNHTIVQYIIQAGWEADTLKQGMGRHKRSNEAAPPEIKNTFTDVIGEKRFASTAAARMAEMGATTRSLAAGGAGLDIFDFDVKYLQTEYGAQALYDFFSALNEGYTFEVPGETNADGSTMKIGIADSEEGGITGIDIVTGITLEYENNMIKKDKMPPVKRFLNRVLGSPSIEIQDALYAEYYKRLQTLLAQAKAEGTLDVGVGTLPVKNAKIVNNTVLATDESSGAKTYGTIVQAEEEVPKVSWDKVKELMESDTHSQHWYVEDPEGNIYLDKEVPARVDAATGESKPWIRRTSPDGSIRYSEAELASGEGWTMYPIGLRVSEDGTETWSMGDPNRSITTQLGSTLHRDVIEGVSAEDIESRFKSKWDTQYEETAATKSVFIRMVQGLMLPVWDKINPPIEYPEGTTHYQNELRKRKLVRINLENGTDIIGRQFTSVGEYNQIFENFGVAAPDQSVTVATVPMNQTGVMNLINQDGYTVQLENGLSIRTRQRAGQTYLVVEGDRSRLESLMNDNILDRFRPGGGGWVYSVSNDNLTTLFSRHKPVRANKRGDILNIDYETPGGTPNTETPEQTPEGVPVETLGHLQALGIDPTNWELWTETEKETEVNRTYEALLEREVNEEDFSISDAQVQAVNALIDSGELGDIVNIVQMPDISPASEAWGQAFPKGKAERNKIRSQYTEQVRQIIDNPNFSDTHAQARLRNINTRLRSGDYFGLQGKQVQNGAEAALISQFIRNPVVEGTMLLFRKENKIVRSEYLSLGKTDRTSPGVIAEVERLLRDENADDFIRVHNHPSAKAIFSEKDKRTAEKWRRHFGTRLAEEVVINEGTYARANFDAQGEATYQNELELDLENGTMQQPEYFGAFFKTPDGWTTLLFLDDAGKVVSAMDVQGLFESIVQTERKIEQLLELTKANRVHVIVGKGQSKPVLTENLMALASRRNPAVESVWIEGRPARYTKHSISRDPNDTSTDEGELGDFAVERQFDNASVIVAPRHDTEMTFEGQDSLKNKGAKGAVQLFSQIDEELGKRVGSWIPAMRKGWNDTMAVFESGRRGLEKLRSKPGAKATPFEAASNDLDLAMIDAVTRISGIRNITNPVLKERKTLISQLSKAEGISRSQLTSDINQAVSDYREHNKPVEDNANLRAYEDDDLMAQVKAYADKEKEAWKQIIRQSDEDIITLVKAAYENNEKLTYPNGEPITPLPIDGFHYDLERDGWVQLTKWNAQQGRMRPTTEAEQEKTYTTAEVFAQAERFYVPHHYTKQHLLTRKDRVNKLLEELNYADATNDVSDIDEMVGIQHNGDKYIFKPTGEDFTAVEAVIQRAKQYWNNEDASVRQYINAHDDGTLARFGHLEHQRKTDDRHYIKDIEVHVKMIEQATRRMSLIAYFGQDHGIIGKSPRFKARMMQMTRYSHTPEEAALLAMYTAMGADKIGMFEHMYDLGSGTPKQDFDILGRWKDKDSGELKDLDIDRLDLSTDQKEILRRMGLLEKDNNENWRVVGSSVKARHQTMQRHFSDYSSTIAGRLKHFMNALNAIADGPIRSLTDDKTNKLVSKVNSATTMLTLGPRTALQNLSELPNLIAAAGMGNFVKGMKFLTNPDSKKLVKMLSSALDHGHRYMSETKGEQWYLQSPLSLFAQSELLSREAGVAVGWVNAKSAIENYLKTPNKATRYALDDVKINKNVIDAFKAEAGQVNLEKLFTEAEQRILHGSMPTGGFQKVGASPASNKWVDILGQELQRSAVYMSQDFLKRYDAYSLPPFLAQRHPFVSLFFKYRSWGFQNHELLARRWRQAWRQGKIGNWTPFLNMSLAAGVLTPLGIGALGFAFTVFQALDDDDPFALDVLKTFTAAQSFGMASILIDAVAHAGENPFRLEHSLRGQYSGPALSIATRILAPVFTGDLKEVLEQTSRRLPISREAHYFGAGQIFDEE